MTEVRDKVFALPPGCNFAGAFADGLLARYGSLPPEELARVQVYVNTRRSGRAIVAELGARGVILQPRIQALADLAADPMALPDAVPALSPLRRQLILGQLVGKFLQAKPGLAPRSAMFELAKSLGGLLDEMQGAGMPLRKLAEVDAGRHSEHWQNVLSFLNILTDYWQHHRPGDALDPEARARAVVTAYADLWQSAPPETPVIVAGSTGSRPYTALLMQAVAALPQGCVVLPGYDWHQPERVWQQLGPDHPQYGFSLLAELIGFPHDLPRWHESAEPAPERGRLVSLALRPAPVTDQWLAEGPALASTLPDALAGMTLVEAPSKRAEALAIAVRLRMALEAGETAALVTPDRVLARYVTAALARWRIDPDDSAGRPLPLTPPGVFLRRVLDIAGAPPTPAALLALLKHPLCGGVGADRRAHLAQTRAIESGLLRGGAPFLEWPALEAWAAKRPAPEPTLWVAGLRRVLDPWITVAGTKSLAEWLELHRTAAEALARGLAESGAGVFWDKQAGQSALQVFTDLAAQADASGPLSLPEYRALFHAILTGEVREEAYRPDPRVKILGTLEARVQSADVVVLGGLNDTVWPGVPDPDPWLNRDMRRQIGLEVPERQVGLSAHDFQQAIGARQVVLSRALRDGDSPTVASRLLTRVLSLAGGLAGAEHPALEAMRARGRQLLAWAQELEAPLAAVAPAPRPAPSPPLPARPDALSVTQVETLIRDPYAIYARHVLRLRKLKPLGRDPDALERGKVMHAVLEEFVLRTLDGLPENAVELLRESAREIIARDVPWPSIAVLWNTRISQLAGWLAGTEATLREHGTPVAGGQEVTGTRRGEFPGGTFTLTAKADRVDLGAVGARIYDYKTGAPPSKKQVAAFARQLPLEGSIAATGGFEGVPAAEPEALIHIGLGSGGTLQELPEEERDAEKVWAEFLTLIAAYGSREVGYPARIRPQHLTYESDYDQLSRLGEWEDGAPYQVGKVGE